MEKLIIFLWVLIFVAAFIIVLIEGIVKLLFQLLVTMFTGAGIYGIITVVSIVVFIIAIVYIINN